MNSSLFSFNFHRSVLVPDSQYDIIGLSNDWAPKKEQMITWINGIHIHNATWRH